MKKNRSDSIAIILNMVWSVIAVLINYFINFLITPYITNNIGVEAYGFVSLATTFTNYIDIISVGLNAFACRYISIAYHKNDKKQANIFYSSTIIADFVLSIVVFLPCCLIVSKLEMFLNIPDTLVDDVKILFVVVLIKYLLTVLRTAYNSASFIANRLDIYEKHLSISYILQAAILLFLCVIFPPHVWYVGLAGIVAVSYLLIINYRLTKRFVSDLKFKRKYCSIYAVKQLVSSGIWNSINNLGNVLNSGLDLLITNLMIDATVLGQISIGKNIGTICYTLISKISSSFRPKQLKLYAEGKLDEQVALFKTTMKITGLFCNVIICVFFSCGLEFLHLWIPKQDNKYIFQMLMIVLFSDISIGVVNPLYYVFTLTNKLKIPCAITVGMGILNVLSMYILIKHTSLGAYAVVLTTLVLNFTHFIDTPLYAAYCLGVKLTTFYPPILRHVVATVVGVATCYLLSKNLFDANTWVLLIVKGSIVGAISLLLLSLLTFNKSELSKLLKKILK